MIELTTDQKERAALFALGSLPTTEAAAFAEEMARLPALAAEVGGLRRLTNHLEGALERTPPPPPWMKERMLDRVRAERARPAQPWRGWQAPRGEEQQFIVRRDAAPFEPTAFDGVDTRRLNVDPKTGRITMLVRMRPGSIYPSHEHGGYEECFVLEGDIDVGGTQMKAGDYQLSPQGSRHPRQSTRDGCLLLITTSPDDQLLEG